MLSDDDPKVPEMFEKLTQKQIPETEVKESLASGTSWPKCHAKHQLARQQIAEKFDLEAGRLVSYCSFSRCLFIEVYCIVTFCWVMTPVVVQLSPATAYMYHVSFIILSIMCR